MKENWDQISEWIKVSEGGYVNNPKDPGGATKYGVTLRVLEAWRGEKLTPLDVKALGWDEAKNILREQYWDAVSGDSLPAGLDYSVADAAFNSGQVQAVKWLQAAVGAKPDGMFGLATVAAVKAVGDVNAAIDRYDAARLGFLRHLRTWPVFGKGWFTRVNLVLTRSHALAKVKELVG